MLDLNLPKMDGREVLAHIKEDPSLKTIPTVILTTSEAEADIVKSYQLQANCYLSKPVQLDAFESPGEEHQRFLADQSQVATAETKRMIRKSLRLLLLVEDNPGDARLLREMLNEAGAHKTEMTQVESMREAEKHLSRSAFDIVLLDLGLPDAQGLEAVRRARAVAPRVPLVVLTGLDDESVAAQALKKARRTISSKAKSRLVGFCGPCVTPSNARPWKKHYSW